MEKEDDKLKELFEEYSDRLELNDGFLDRLVNGMDAIDIVTQHQVSDRKRMRIVVFISAFLGFVCGVVMTLFYPRILAFSESCLQILSNMVPSVEMDASVISYLIISVACLSVTFGSYFLILPNFIIDPFRNKLR